MSRLFLSSPDVGNAERAAILRAFDSGWIAPVGPDLDAFEAELRERTGRHAVALASGTAALHLALLAVTSGVPVVAVSVNPKVTETFASMGRGGCVIDPAGVKPRQLAEAVLKV